MVIWMKDENLRNELGVRVRDGGLGMEGMRRVSSEAVSGCQVCG